MATCDAADGFDGDAVVRGDLRHAGESEHVAFFKGAGVRGSVEGVSDDTGRVSKTCLNASATLS